jgi:division protein CdvB (Snf7/Vps24/ESCRT-III family)
VTMKLMMMKGDTGVVPADIMVVGPESQVTEDVVSVSDRVGLHDPTSFDMIDAVLVENNGAYDGVPKLEDNMGEDSDNEADDDERGHRGGAS